MMGAMDDVETHAAFLAVIRHELQLPRGIEPLVALALRLTPPDKSERPPRSAPGIARLVKALRRLEARKAPAGTIEQFSEDLRFLRMFGRDADAWTAEALSDLMANVLVADSAPKRADTPGARDATCPPLLPFPRDAKAPRTKR